MCSRFIVVQQWWRTSLRAAVEALTAQQHCAYAAKHSAALHIAEAHTATSLVTQFKHLHMLAVYYAARAIAAS
jgi:hypothetical protein